MLDGETVLAYPDDGRTEKLGTEADSLVMVTCMNIAGECVTPQEIFSKDPQLKVDVPESVHPDFAAFMINQNCWETIGEFDELFAKAYFEDNCFHRRIKLAGLKAITLPTSLYYHYGSRTQNQDLNPLTAITKSQMFEKNRRFYIQKWGGGTDEEKFTHPFNDPKKDLRWTLQSSHAEDCDCEVKCREIRRQKL
jgi:GT2 family glycosyltransferase